LNNNKNISKNDKNVLQIDKRCGILRLDEGKTWRDILMWNDSKSLLLSKICVILFMALLLICAIVAPRLVRLLTLMSMPAFMAGPTLFMITIYSGCVPAAALLAWLYVLLHRIGAGRVFVKENTACLRYISWCCFAGAAICLASALYYIPWTAVGISAAFMGIIVRVVKNVVAKAVSLQDDAEFTI